MVTRDSNPCSCIPMLTTPPPMYYLYPPVFNLYFSISSQSLSRDKKVIFFLSLEDSRDVSPLSVEV